MGETRFLEVGERPVFLIPTEWEGEELEAYRKKLNFEDSKLSIPIPGISLYENFISEDLEK